LQFVAFESKKEKEKEKEKEEKNEEPAEQFPLDFTVAPQFGEGELPTQDKPLCLLCLSFMDLILQSLDRIRYSELRRTLMQACDSLPEAKQRPCDRLVRLEIDRIIDNPKETCRMLTIC